MKRTTSGLNLPSSFNSNGRTITDPVKIANEFCHYFTNIGPTLASKIQTTNSAFQNFVGPANVRNGIFQNAPPKNIYVPLPVLHYCSRH